MSGADHEAEVLKREIQSRIELKEEFSGWDVTRVDIEIEHLLGDLSDRVGHEVNLGDVLDSE